MKSCKLKHNILLYSLTAIAVAVLIALACIVSFGRVAPVLAEGNNAGSANVTSIQLVLNVNGRIPQDTEYDNNTPGTTIADNNTKPFKRRRISPSIAVNRYNELVSASGAPQIPSGSYFYDFGSIVKSSTCFRLSRATGTDNSALLITADSITEARIPAYFSIDVYDSSNTENRYTLYFNVTVQDTFAQRTSANNEFYVGYKIGNDGLEYYEDLNGNTVKEDSYKDGKHASILSVNNFSTFSIDLSEYLVGRALYNKDHGKITQTQGGNEFWALDSANNFRITSASFSGLSVNIDNMILTSSIAYDTNVMPVRISPTLTGSVSVSSNVVDAYNELAGPNAFWTEIHFLRLEMSHISGTADACIVNIPFKFIPANPQANNISASTLRLNITSEYTYDLSNRTFSDANGETINSASDYGAIILRPADLVDYAFPANYPEMVFEHSGTTLDGTELSKLTNVSDLGITVSRIAGEENSSYPTAYVVRAAKNASLSDSSYNLAFNLAYYTSEDRTHPEHVGVEINVSTYGGYTITFNPIRGKREVEYNTLSDEIFAQLRDRGYMLTDATSSDENLLYATLQNGVLTLSPQVKNLTGEANVAISLTFKNYRNQILRFDSAPVNINVNAGSLFARFDDWEAWLIIAAICLGALIIILVIVFLFIRAVSKRREAELATQAPVSSYIVKLNSTIAQNQAQQRAAQNQALSQASQMLLGAGPTGAAATPPPDTLALASGVASQPGSPSMSMPGSGPAMSEPQATVPPTDGDENLEELIAKYITDDELLERIFTEKYEPKGMVRRTFFKSKDLQARELDKEKKRIIERYKTPMPMDEAIMSETEIANSEKASTPQSSQPQETSEPKVTEMFVLDFDPDSPLYVEQEVKKDEFSEEKIDLDSSPEEQKLKDIEHKLDVLSKELAELESRMGKVTSERDKARSLEDELREKITKAEEDDAQYAKNIEDLEFKLASAKNKDKPIITRDIGINEEKKKRNLDELEKLRADLDALITQREKLDAVYGKLESTNTEKTETRETLVVDREKAQADFNAYQERLAKVRAKQELEAKVISLTPLLVAVNETEHELKKLQSDSDLQDKERDKLNGSVAAAKSQIMSTTDFGVIGELNMQISDANARLAEIEKETARATKRRSELTIDFNAQRRKANEFVETNEIPLEEVIKAEDVVIGNIELEVLKSVRQADKDEAEKAVADAQAVYDDLTASAGDVTLVAMEVASGINDIEEEIAAAQAALDEVNLQMESAGEDEKLMLMVEQGDKSDKLEELKAKLEQAHVDGTKRKMEAQSEYDEKLEAARKALEQANEEFERACGAYDDLVHNTNPVDLIESGSGVISRDQKIIEAENLKKQLERSKNEIEQARLAAQQAQEEAERVRLEAERQAEEARQDAERARIEAEERAEQARLDAERQAEEARREAEEKAQQARLEAEEKARAEIEAAERAKQEAAEALAAESEEAKRKAQEESEEAKRKAQEEAEEAKRKAQEDIEEMRRKAEEEAEAKRIEEENKQKEEEERKKAEAAREEALAKKIAARKEQIIAIRNDMKELKGDDDAKHLRERLYNIQLTFDEDERGSTELMDFYNKTMDDIQNAGEIARLKAENAKKPQRVVRKVTERVNRIPKRRPGARPAAHAGARPGARPSGARPAARPGARPSGARPAPRPGARPGGGRPTRPR